MTGTRWQYLVVEIKPGLMGGFKSETIQSELAKHGQQGWELVSMVCPSSMSPMLATFKREH